MQLGFLGTGAITTAVVTGLCRGHGTSHPIQVSPRNPGRAAALAETFSNVTVATDNQSVVDASDVVFLAVRPAITPEVLTELQFRPGQKIVSLVPTLGTAEVGELVAPAAEICRITPLPPCARGRGAVVTYGTDAEIDALLAPLGELLAVTSERELHLLIATTALISPLYTVLAEAAAWARNGGVQADVAERYLAGMTSAICQDRLDSEESLLELAQEAATPGGLNEGARRSIAAAGGFQSFHTALDEIAARLGETPPQESEA